MSQITIYEKTPANPKEAIATLKELLEKSKGKIAEVVPRHLSPDRLARIAISATSRNPTLLKCTPMSILGAVMQSASMGLEAGGPLGDAYLVPFRNNKTGTMEATLIVGYRGMISLARRSGQILSIEADVVHANDVWFFKKTQDGTLFEHTPCEDKEPGEILRAYAVARLKDTPIPVVIVMPKREIESIRLRAKKGDRTTPWDTDYAEMCKKTAIRRICKQLPMSIEMADAIDREDRAEHGIGADDVDFIDLSLSAEGTPDTNGKSDPLDALVKPPKAKPPVAEKKMTIRGADGEPIDVQEAAPVQKPKSKPVAGTQCNECGEVDDHTTSDCPNIPIS